MLSFWNFFLEKRAFSFLLVFALVVLGLFSAVRIPKESSPEIQIPIAVVSTLLPGASAEDVETLVTNVIEDQLGNTLENVDTISSTSRESISSVVVEFDGQADIDESLDEVQKEIDKVKRELPESAEDPVVSDVNFVDQPIMLVSISSDLSASAFINLSEEVIDELKKVRGVSRVQKSGLPEREVQVIVNKEKLRTYGLDLSQVVAAIARTNTTVPVGSIQLNGVEYALQFEGDIQDPAQIADIAILSAQGEPVYIRDIAFVSDGVSKTTSFSRVSTDGSVAKQAMSLSLFKTRGGDVTQIARDINTKLDELREGILANSTVLVSFDSGDLVEQDLTNLSRTGLQTVALVMLLLLITIGWREAFIAGVAIPLSFLLAFIGLLSSGNTINFVSLFSLILAVGILVDSSIVITEGIHTNMHKGLSRKKAARQTLRDFMLPLIAGTATTVAVFVPLFFISGVTGEFIAIIPFTIVFVLLASLFVALGIIPLIASSYLKKRSETTFEKKQEYYTERLKDWYRGVLRSFLGNKKKERTFFIIMAVLFVGALALPITGIVKTIFFGQEDIEFAYIEIEKQEGTVLGQTDITARAVEELLYGAPDIESFVTTVGASSGFGNNPQSGDKLANITVILRDDRKRTSAEIVEDLRDRLSGIRDADIRVYQLSGGPPTGVPIVVRLFGEDLDALERAANTVEAVLVDIPGTTQVTSSARDNGTQFVLTVDKAKATSLGIDPAAIAQVLRTAVYGSTATTIKGGQDDIDVVVKLNLNPGYRTPHDTARTTADSVRYIELQTPNGPVLLGSIVDITIARANAVIRHEDRGRFASVSSEVRDGFNTLEITQKLQEEIEKRELPEGVRVEVGGENEEVDQSFQDLFAALIAGVLLVLAILVLQFNSYRQALFIISIIPFSLIGIFSGLLLSGQTLSFPSIMGYIALSGIVVNNSIILIDVINKMRQLRPDLSVRECIIEGSASRLRPIILTTVTTVVGIFPLTYAAEIWAPLAYSVMFGLSFAVIVTLLLVPILYDRWPGKNGHGEEDSDEQSALPHTPRSDYPQEIELAEDEVEQGSRDLARWPVILE